VKVHYGEGVATHTGPESCALRREASREALTDVAPDPCAVLREDDCEASVGERIGQPLSRGAPGDRQEVSGESPLR